MNVRICLNISKFEFCVKTVCFYAPTDISHQYETLYFQTVELLANSRYLTKSLFMFANLRKTQWRHRGNKCAFLCKIYDFRFKIRFLFTFLQCVIESNYYVTVWVTHSAEYGWNLDKRLIMCLWIENILIEMKFLLELFMIFSMRIIFVSYKK